MIALVDYGAGNLTSVRKALSSLDAEFVVPESPALCADAEGLIVPGVGHFASTSRLDKPWRTAIADAVRAGTPLLGICVGMQWLFEGSDEAPDVPGIGLLPGQVARLRGDAARRLKVPHVGWNALDFTRASSRLLHGVESGAHVYFTHSYAAPAGPHTAAVTRHGIDVPAVVEKDNVFGVQFHPEKSGPAGVRMLRTFVEICRAR